MTEPDTAGPAAPIRHRHPRLTVRGCILSVIASVGVLILVFAAVLARELTRTVDLSDHLRGVVQPAQLEAHRLQNAILNQEIGARGYIQSADPQFLEPYERGRAAEHDASVTLRTLIVGAGERATQLLADLDAVEAAVEQWRLRYTLPLMETVQPGAPRAADPDVVEAGRVSFAELNDLFDVQNRHLDEARASAVAGLEEGRAVRDAVFTAMIVAFVLSAVGVAVLVQVLVVRPLTRLRDETRDVAAGDFDRRIGRTGPSDVRALARDVDAMRERLARELARSTDDRRRLESQAVELRRSNAELEQFAYVASHDLQEPLRKVASFCRLLEKRYSDELDERGLRYIDFAVDGAQRMQTLINDLLAFSRVGRSGSARTVVDLGTVLDRAVNNLSALIDDAGARIERPTSLPGVVGDATLLVMLWQNLIGNAVKFADPARTPVVRIECERSTDGRMWQLSVTDNGIGIAPEFTEKVFVIFQRLHPREDYDGTGIGLALCRKIVEVHGGGIGIDTDVVEGTRIRFTLPTETGPSEAIGSAAEGASA